MPRVLQAEERLVAAFHENLQRSSAFETGLLVAHAGSKTDTLLRLVATPPDEGGQAAVLDASWALEHGKQVARMLPGGVVVLGCYAFAPTAKLAGLEVQLQPVLASLAKRLPASVSDRQAALLLLPTDAKKAACRTLPLGAPKLQAAELKMMRAPAQPVCLACDWDIDLKVRLGGGDRAAQLQQLRAQLEPSFALLRGALATVNGASPKPSMPVSQLESALGTPARPHSVKLFALSPAADAPAAAAAASSAAVRLTGSMHGRVFTQPKEEVGPALAALRDDLCASLAARLDLLLEELAEDGEDGDEAGPPLRLDVAGSHGLPRRAHVEFAADGRGAAGLSLCDYVLPSEAPSDCAQRLVALLGYAAPAAAADEEELAGRLGPEFDDYEVAEEEEEEEEAAAAEEASAGPPDAAAKAAGRRTKAGTAVARSGGGIFLPVAAVVLAVLLAVVLGLQGGWLQNAGPSPQEDAAALAAALGAEKGAETEFSESTMKK